MTRNVLLSRQGIAFIFPEEHTHNGVLCSESLECFCYDYITSLEIPQEEDGMSLTSVIPQRKRIPAKIHCEEIRPTA